jgi:hypothetical protein
MAKAFTNAMTQLSQANKIAKFGKPSTSSNSLKQFLAPN